MKSQRLNEVKNRMCEDFCLHYIGSDACAACPLKDLNELQIAKEVVANNVCTIIREHGKRQLVILDENYNEIDNWEDYTE